MDLWPDPVEKVDNILRYQGLMFCKTEYSLILKVEKLSITVCPKYYDTLLENVFTNKTLCSVLSTWTLLNLHILKFQVQNVFIMIKGSRNMV